MAKPGALESYNADEIIQRIYDGEIPANIALEVGVNKCSIYRFLADHPEYQQARQIGMAVRLDAAEMAVLTADERTLMRAREAWRVVTWRAEREHRSIWGQQAGATININGEGAATSTPSGITINFVAPQQSAKAIDSSCTKVPDNAKDTGA